MEERREGASTSAPAEAVVAEVVDDGDSLFEQRVVRCCSQTLDLAA